MSKKPRRHIDGSQKLAIAKRHLVDKVPVSDLRDEYQIQPAQFYPWQKQLHASAIDGSPCRDDFTGKRRYDRNRIEVKKTGASAIPLIRPPAAKHQAAPGDAY